MWLTSSARDVASGAASALNALSSGNVVKVPLRMMVSADPVQPTFVEAIPAFADNYIWALRRGDRIAVVDPGDALAVERYLDRRNGQLVAILITHHHGDHTGGVSDLVAGRDIPVFGPALSRIAHVNRPLRGGERLVLDALGLAFDVWHVPGHTLDHLAYVGEDDLFCGDTLFAAGCGRLFEGTGAQMFDSLSRLASLPDRTRVFLSLIHISEPT
ncbi:MAG: MBL fold metallo-hydrolase, partial [Gemmataceae bacterium]|nr:MBL fold metallo-hydrolase [Gemmataceae bacterium]